MMSLKTRISAAAYDRPLHASRFAEREAIYDHIESENPAGALKVKRAIVQAVRALGLFPRLGRKTELRDVRELIVPRYPYKIYYRIESDDEVWILHVRDARRKTWEGK